MEGLRKMFAKKHLTPNNPATSQHEGQRVRFPVRLSSEARPPPNISKERKAGKTQTGRRTNRRDNRKRKKVVVRERVRESAIRTANSVWVRFKRR